MYRVHGHVNKEDLHVMVTCNRDGPDIGMAHFEPLLISSRKKVPYKTSARSSTFGRNYNIESAIDIILM